MADRIVVCRSNPVAPDPRVEKTARALVAAGYSVQVIGWDRTGEQPPVSKIESEHGTIPLERLLIRGRFGHGLGNLPALLGWQWGLLRWLSSHRAEYDALHACDFDTILPALFCQAVWDKRVIYDIYDFYADHLRATPGWIKRLIRWADLRCIGRADAVILADDSRREQIAGSRPKNLVVVYNSPEDVPLSNFAELMAAQTSHLRLAYIGLLQVERGLSELLAVLKLHPEWRLDLAGFGGDEATLVAQAGQIPNVDWHGRIAYERALKLSQAADVLIATYDPAIPNHRYASPNKIFEAMMLGKPVIVARGTNMDWMIDEADCGLVVEYGDLLQLEAALSSLQHDAELRRRLGQNARRAYENRYRWTVMEARLASLYARLMRSGQP